MDEDSGSPHLLISKVLIKNRFEARPPEKGKREKVMILG